MRTCEKMVKEPVVVPAFCGDFAQREKQSWSHSVSTESLCPRTSAVKAVLHWLHHVVGVFWVSKLTYDGRLNCQDLHSTTVSPKLKMQGLSAQRCHLFCPFQPLKKFCAPQLVPSTHLHSESTSRLELPKTTGSLFRGSWPPFPFGHPGPSSMPDSKLKNHFEMAYHVRPACPTLNKKKNKQQENNCRRKQDGQFLENVTACLYTVLVLSFDLYHLIRVQAGRSGIQTPSNSFRYNYPGP